MTVTGALIAASAALIAACIAAAALFWSKRLEKRNATELKHSEAREDAYNRILAAGDAGWYYRTLQGVDTDVDRTDWEQMNGPVAELFESGLDKLVEGALNLKAVAPSVMRWCHFALEDRQCSPREFEDSRDEVVNLKRQEIGLRKNILRVRELSFYDRLLKGHVVQRLPEGVQNVVRMEDGGFIVLGAGGEFDSFFQDFIARTREIRESRKVARRRLAEWREKGIWKLPPTELEEADVQD